MPFYYLQGFYYHKLTKNVEDLDTVKLGYNEHSVITNKIFSPNWLFYYIYQPGYNETRL